MAGNIIPAIATTNAIIAGFVVMQATNLLARNLKNARRVFLKANPTFPLGLEYPADPDPGCGVCRDPWVALRVDPSKLTIQMFITDIVQQWLFADLEETEKEEFTITEGSREFQEYVGNQPDEDLIDNLEKTFERLCVDRGKVVTVRFGSGKYRPVQFSIMSLWVDLNVSVA